MKIVYILDQLVAAGTQIHVCQLASALSNMGHQITLLCLEEKGPLAKDLESIGVKVVELRMPAINSVAATKKIWRLYRILREEKPDIVQTFLLKANIVGVLAAKMAGVKIIFSSRRSLGYDMNKKHFIAMGFLSYLTNGTLVNSEAIKQATIKNEKISAESIHTIYNGISYSRNCESDSQDLRSQLNIKKGVPIVGIVANIRPVKGIEYLIDAMSEVLMKHPAYLVIVGNTHGNQSYHNGMRSKIKKLNMCDNIRFVHGCNKVQEIIKIFDVAVLSSLSEGFSNTLLEYMAAGKAIIATAVGGNSEAIENDNSGFCIPAGNASILAERIGYLLSNRQRAKALGQRASKRVRLHFTLGQMINNYLQIYQSHLPGIPSGESR